MGADSWAPSSWGKHLDSIPTISTKDALLWTIFLFSAYVLAKVVYRIFLTPLRQVPGPLLAKLTDQWLLCVDLAGHRAMTIHALHQRYGPVVQIGPNELSFASADTLEPIYGQGTGFRKAPVYRAMARPGVFNMRDPAEHRQRRRLMNHAFSQQHLNDLEPAFRNSLKKLVAAIDRRSGNAVDVRHWFRMYAMDNAGEAFLGRSFGGLDSDETPGYVKDFDLIFIQWSIEGVFPKTAWLGRKIPHPGVQHFFNTDNRIYQYGFDRFREYIEENGRVSKRKDLLTKMIGRKENDPEALADKDISVEISNLCFAATDTTGTTLIYLFWELARKPEILARLQKELHDVSLVEGFPSHKELVNCTYLDAVITENMRMYPVTASGLMRETPAGGRVLSGVHVPEGTIVSTHAWTIHHNPEVYPNPDKFDPSRWLDGGSEAMRKHYIPFSKGPRNCIGQALAVFELKLMTATLAMRYNVSIDESMTDDDMAITDHFNIMPKGQKCLLVFTPV